MNENVSGPQKRAKRGPHALGIVFTLALIFLDLDSRTSLSSFKNHFTFPLATVRREAIMWASNGDEFDMRFILTLFLMKLYEFTVFAPQFLLPVCPLETSYQNLTTIDRVVKQSEDSHGM